MSRLPEHSEGLPETENRPRPLEIYRADLLRKLLIPQVLSTISPDDGTAIPPFNISTLSTINTKEQSEISVLVSAQFTDLLYAIPSQLRISDEWKATSGQSVYELNESFWKKYQEKFREHLPTDDNDSYCALSPEFAHVLLEGTFFFECHAYYHGVLVGDMSVRYDKEGVTLLYYNHLFYGDGCALEIEQHVESGALYSKKEIVYPDILTPGHLDFGSEARKKQTHYAGEIHEVNEDSSDIENPLFKNMPEMLVYFHNFLYNPKLAIEEKVQYVGLPVTKRLEISQWQTEPHATWYVYMIDNFVRCVKSYEISETEILSTRGVEQYEATGEIDPRGNFWLPPEFFMQLSEQSPFYKGKSIFILDKQTPYITLATLSTGKTDYTPIKITYSGVEMRGKELIVEFGPDPNASEKWNNIRPIKVFLEGRDVTKNMQIDPSMPLMMNFNHPEIPLGILVQYLNDWEISFNT